MGCRSCGSDHQQSFAAESSITFPGMKGFSLAPVYVSANLLICLNCGYAEFAVSPAELERLKKGVDSVRSAGA